MLDPPGPGWQARTNGTLRTGTGDPRVRGVLVDSSRTQGGGDQGPPGVVGQPVPGDPGRPDRLLRGGDGGPAAHPAVEAGARPPAAGPVPGAAGRRAEALMARPAGGGRRTRSDGGIQWLKALGLIAVLV